MEIDGRYYVKDCLLCSIAVTRRQSSEHEGDSRFRAERHEMKMTFGFATTNAFLLPPYTAISNLALRRTLYLAVARRLRRSPTTPQARGWD